MFRFLQGPGGAAPIGPYSPGVVVPRNAEWIVLSGQIALSPIDGTLQDESTAVQTALALANVEQLLKEAGAGRTNVVFVTVLLRDMADFASMNEAYERFFGDHKPARATFQAAALPKSAAVEIVVIAAIPVPSGDGHGSTT